jgi:hypothetical protein
VGAFPVWRPNLDELDVDSAHASAFLILNSFEIIPLQLRGLLACLPVLSDGLGARKAGSTAGLRMRNPATFYVLSG